MSTKNCKVDVVSVVVNQLVTVKLKMTFQDILRNPEILNKEKRINNKTVHYSIINQDDNNKYIVGFLQTTLDKDLPAKINKETKTISTLDVKENEGLVFGSVFLYSIELNCLFFEVNKNSIYLNIFKDFIYKCYNESQNLKDQTSFDIDFGTIYRKKEYERALKMSSYKSFKLKIHQPAKLLQNINEVNKTLNDKVKIDFLPQIEQAAELNSEIAEIEFNVSNAKKTGGLYRDKILPIIDSFKNLLGYSEIRNHIDTVEVCGYTSDSKVKKPIDLIGDVYYTSFKITVPRLDSNLQKKERKESIEKVYEREFPILSDYI